MDEHDKNSVWQSSGIDIYKVTEAFEKLVTMIWSVTDESIDRKLTEEEMKAIFDDRLENEDFLAGLSRDERMLTLILTIFGSFRPHGER